MNHYVIAILSLKGGVGSTTTAFNVAQSLALKGKKILLIDFNPNNDLSRHLNHYDLNKLTIEDLLYSKLYDKYIDVGKFIIKHNENIDYIPASLTLTSLQSISELADMKNNPLQSITNNCIENRHYDFILFDCSSNVSTLMTCCINACDYVIVPVQSQYFALNSLHKTIDIVSKINNGANEKIFGILLTMFDRTDMALAVEEAIMNNTFLKSKLFATKISKSTKATYGFLGSNNLFQSKSKFKDEYTLVVNEILERLE